MKITSQIISFFLIVMIQSMMSVASRRMKKRQIYREQVLPHTGGKIPESAFETDRLLLNRLQKEGIAIPDGILLEQRNPKAYPYPHNDLRPVFKVPLTPDGRYTPDEGQIHYNTPPTSETTYPIPRITQDILLPMLSPHALHNFPQITTPVHATVYEPFYRPFNLPNPLHGVASVYNDINTNTVQPNHQYAQQPIKDFQLPYAQAHQIHPSTSSSSSSSLNHYALDQSVANKAQPQPFHSTVNYYEQEYLTSQIMNDISRFLHNYNLVGSGLPFGIPLD